MTPDHVLFTMQDLNITGGTTHVLAFFSINYYKSFLKTNIPQVNEFYDMLSNQMSLRYRMVFKITFSKEHKYFECSFENRIFTFLSLLIFYP